MSRNFIREDDNRGWMRASCKLSEKLNAVCLPQRAKRQGRTAKIAVLHHGGHVLPFIAEKENAA